MQATLFAARAAAVASVLFAQFYLLTTQGILPGVPTALMHQTGLQVLAAIVAPTGFRAIAAALAAWVSALLAVGVAFSWATFVIPFAALNAMINGEPTLMLQLLGLTVFLLIPAAVVVGALWIDTEID